MGIVFRQSVKATIITFTGALLGAMMIWLYSFIDKQQFGFIRDIGVQALIIAQFLALGFNATMSVFIHRYDEDAKKRHTLIGICLLVPFLFCILATAIYCIFPEQSIHILFERQDEALIRRYFIWLPAYAAFYVFQMIMEQYLTAQMKIAPLAFIREILLRLFSIALIVLFVFHYINFDILLIGTVVSSLLSLGILFIISLRTKDFGIALNRNAFTRKEYKEIAKFSFFHTLTAVSIYLIGFLDVFLLGRLDKDGVRSVAVYGVAVFFVSVIWIPNRAMINAAYTNIAKEYNAGNLPLVRNLYSRLALNSLLASTFVAVIICCNLHNLVGLMGKGGATDNGYQAVVPLVAIMVIGRLLDIATGMNDQLLSISKYYRFSFYMSATLVVVLTILCVLLIPTYGVYGAAWGTTIALGAYNIAKFFFAWIKLGIQPFSKDSLRTIFCNVPGLVIGYFLPFFFSSHTYAFIILDAFLRCSIIIVIYVIMLFWLKPSVDVREYVANIRKTKRLF